MTGREIKKTEAQTKWKEAVQRIGSGSAKGCWEKDKEKRRGQTHSTRRRTRTMTEEETEEARRNIQLRVQANRKNVHFKTKQENKTTKCMHT